MLDLCEVVLDADEINEGDDNPDVDDDNGLILFVVITLLDAVCRLIFWYEFCRPLAATPGEDDLCKSTEVIDCRLYASDGAFLIGRCGAEGLCLSIGIVFISGL